jgi:hypothetical protein
MNNIEIGDIVNYNDSEDIYVITGINNWEGVESTCYNRQYFVIPLSEIEDKEYINEYEGLQIDVKGTVFPFTNVEGVVPFRLTKEVRYKVERKIPKTIVVYE